MPVTQGILLGGFCPTQHSESLVLISFPFVSLYRVMQVSQAARLLWTHMEAGVLMVAEPSQERTTPRWTAQQLMLPAGWPSPW